MSIPLRMNAVRKIVQSVCYTTLLKRPMAYKSSISLETLYPNSSLKITTPSFSSDPNEKWSGYIPVDKLDITYSASSGPGGQNVNKVHTKVDLRFKLSDAEWLHQDIRTRMVELHGNKLSKEGYLILRSDSTRSQQLNLASCLQKLRNMIRDASVTKRQPTPETEERIRQSEAMRALGFPQPISLESFRTPNWPLVEELVRWLAARLEPDAALAGGRGSLEQRVALVTHATALFHSRANLKLNGKKLYGADGWAVRELLKVATLLRAALRAPAPHDEQREGGCSYDISHRLGEIKQARALATDITAQGAFLYDLLAKEPENKEQREQALARPLDMSAMEACLRRALEAAGARAAAAREQIDSVAASEAALDAKLERRRAELLRAEKRLHTVQKIKPAYQGELTALEGEIEQLWDQYVLRYRCVEALKHQLSLLESAQAEAAEEQQAAIMQLIHKYEAEDVLGKLSDSEELESSDDGGQLSERQPRPATRPRTRLRIKTAGTAAAEARRAFGSMAAAARDSLDEIRDEDDSQSDSDFSDRQIYAAEPAPAPPSRWSRPRPRPATRTLAAADDDDFADLIEGVEGGEGGGGGDSLGSSSESELRMSSARPSAAQGRTSALSDNEF